MADVYRATDTKLKRNTLGSQPALPTTTTLAVARGR